MSITREIAKFIHDFQYEQIPKSVIPAIKNAFIDTIGVGIAGSEEKGSQIIKNFICAEDAKPTSTIWNSEKKTSPSYAALVNGAMAHALDYDDVNGATQGHPSTVLVPAIMAAAEEKNSNGKSIILSYFVGFETMAYIGKMLTMQHYLKGWHATSTFGVLGAAASVGKLYGLSIEQLQTALGIAVSHSSGTKQNFGTMTKPYHPGNAARSGIVSATLAQMDFTANNEIMDAPLGFLKLYGDRSLPAIKEKIGEKFELVENGISTKKYPCCFATHRPADAAFELTRKNNIIVDYIDEIYVRAPQGAYSPVIHSRPSTGLEGKFSVEYVLATVLLDQKVNLQTFTDEGVQREDVQNLLKKVVKIEDESIPVKDNAIDEGFVEVTIKVKDQTFVQKVYHPKGSPQIPLTQEEFHEKFLDCVLNKLDAVSSNRIIEIMSTLEEERDLNNLFKMISQNN